jgi:serine protease Do
MRIPLRARSLLAGLALLVLPFAPRAAAAEEADDVLRKAIEAAKRSVYPALVNISTLTRAFSQGRAQRFPAAGSGVIVSKDGHVVTNFHVIDEATRVTCRLPTGEKIDADVLCGDPPADLAILKLRLAEREDPSKPIPFAPFGDSDKVQVGDYVLAMGNPRSLSSSVTLGIVSNTQRVFTNFTGDSMDVLDLGEGQLTGLFSPWIQHDALIQPGNSGGPLVNLKGEVIGINTRGGEGTGFAIPSNLVKRSVEHALSCGEVRRGWIGVNFMPVVHLGRKTGALISAVLPEGTAAKAGLQPGDIVLSIEGVPTNVDGFEDVPPLYGRIADLPLDKPAMFRILRGTEEKTVEVLIVKMDKFLGVERVYDEWGITAMSITPPMAWARHYPDTKGVVIRSLRPGHPAEIAKPKLERGDVVIAVAGELVVDEPSFAALVRKHAGKKAVGVRFRRDRLDMVTVLDLETKPPKGGGTELPRAWLGVQTQVLTPTVAEALGMKGTQGFRVARVLPGTEAEKAGIKPGDVITHLNGDALKASQQQDAEILRRRIEDMDIGGDATLKVLRDGKPVEIKVTLQETPDTAADVDKAKDEVLEFAVREMTYMDWVDLADRAPPGSSDDSEWRGLFVAEVAPGGWANVNGLRGGDVLISYQDLPTRTLQEFKDAVKKVAESRPKVVKLYVRRDRSTAFVFVQPDWPAK